MDRIEASADRVMVVNIRTPDVRYYERQPDDGGFVRRFQEWMLENGIHQTRVAGGMSGPGMFTGCFYEDEAKKVIDWLKEQPEIDEVPVYDVL